MAIIHGGGFNPTFRPHYGGATSTVDQHLEIYEGVVDTVFKYSQNFQSWSAQKSTAERSNNYRIDRLAGSEVKGRKAGETIVDQRVASDKFNVVVEVMLYIRHPIDYMDDWTAPDFMPELGQNAGTAFGRAYDQAHIIRLQKAGTWVAPAHLKTGGAFYDGFFKTAALLAPAVGTPLTEEQMEDNAAALVTAHGDAVNELIKRRVPVQDLITIVTPAVYSELLHSKKVISSEFSTGAGDFAGRRVVHINGIPVVEHTEFPTGAVIGHPLSTTGNGNAFDVTAAEATAEMIIFSKNLSLVTVTAKGWTTRFYDDEPQMTNVLDCFSMLTIDTRRPDTVAPIRVTRTAAP